EALALTGPDTATRWMIGVMLATITRDIDRAALQHELTQMAAQLAVSALALGAFVKKNGYWPERLDLARGPHFRLTPIDLFTDRPMIYRQTPDGFALYSVGENGVDDLGHNPSHGPDYS